MMVEGVGNKDKNNRKTAVAHVILTCDMYKSNLRHIHDPVLSSLKKKVYFLFLYFLFILEPQNLGILTQIFTKNLDLNFGKKNSLSSIFGKELCMLLKLGHFGN
jgi:hypothetical protein